MPIRFKRRPMHLALIDIEEYIEDLYVNMHNILEFSKNKDARYAARHSIELLEQIDRIIAEMRGTRR